MLDNTNKNKMLKVASCAVSAKALKKNHVRYRNNLGMQNLTGETNSLVEFKIRVILREISNSKH